jgi:hypothetical protein
MIMWNIAQVSSAEDLKGLKVFKLTWPLHEGMRTSISFLFPGDLN